jgi:ABC-2 type transport system ATP-binding protein
VLSSGEQTRVALAKAMLNRPRLLLLDEPTASIDPASARAIRAHIVALAAEGGGGVLWTSHNMYEVAQTCHRVLFLSQGRILLQGEPEGLIREHGAANLEDLFVSVANEQLAPGNGGR